MNFSSSFTKLKGSAMFKKQLKMFVIGIVLALLMYLQPYKLVVVVGDSMLPTLKSGNILLAVKANKIHHGDIVVAYNDYNEKIIKRIAYVPEEYYYYHYQKNDALPLLIVDNSFKNVSHWKNVFNDEMMIELKVPKNHYYLLGDNFNNSDDSRRFGTIERSQILYKVIL
jgi:signal peptidase I